MSFLQAFNYTYVPSLNLGALGGSFSSQIPFGDPNRFAQQSQSQQQFSNGFSPSPTPPGANIPIPESIVQNPQSYVDYYGNPTIQQDQQQQQPNNILNNQISDQFYDNNQQQQQNIQQEYSQPQQQQQQQSTRRRRPKNARARNANNAPSALTYGPEHVQHLQNFNTLQNPQTPSATNQLLRVTPIQGPIFAKDGHVPVVPLYSYNAVRNGTFYQIPILWTALSYALGLEIRGEILRGLPCIKRLNQLFCPTAGNTYPLDNIERFIDENKALIKRMYGEFVMNSESFAPPLGGNTLRRSAREIYEDEVPEFLNNKNPTAKHTTNLASASGNVTDEENVSHIRTVRQTVNPRNGGPTQQPKSNRVDSCESTVEIVTPYWAANSAGKVRAIVNTQHFEQAIHQEVCSKTSTKRCTNDCGCEQKYKWHRLLAYDPDNDCRGIFMDWFLFPSCCVCRCNPIP